MKFGKFFEKREDSGDATQEELEDLNSKLGELAQNKEYWKMRSEDVILGFSSRGVSDGGKESDMIAKKLAEIDAQESELKRRKEVVEEQMRKGKNGQ